MTGKWHVKDDMMTDSSDEYWEDDDYFVGLLRLNRAGDPTACVYLRQSRMESVWIASPLLTYHQSFAFQKLSGYFLSKTGFSKGRIVTTFATATEDWKKLPPLQYYHGSDPAVVLAFDPQLNIESFYHVVAAVSLLDHPVVCFEIYYSESDSWRCSPSDCLELENTSLAAVLHVPIIQSEQRGALTQLGDEVCYVTAYNDSENVFVIDIYGGVDMSLKHSVSVNLGSKEPHTQVFGMPKEESCELMLVYEYVPNKNLGIPSSWQGTSCHPKIIHCDIKAANILLEDNFKAKVADFGLAKLSSDNFTHISTRVMGTFGYLAPEYASTGKLTDKSDVFSFGVARPLLRTALEEGKYDELVGAPLEGKSVPNELHRLVVCAAASTRHSAKRRPKMSQIVRALDGDSSLEDMSDGTKPGAFGSSGSSELTILMHTMLDLIKFRKMVMSTQEFDSSEYGATSDYGLNPSSSSSSGDSRELDHHQEGRG
ncbi:hypothetical protein HAX54_001644 [Datura stramonium]|uniref:non-specific serine/threonine protein kinase n=1 Tax=Datura stramonium TaxID=4076 RepID=A0ABS8T2P4_DATST|nr:hypothetical protein [Datura stramonium]